MESNNVDWNYCLCLSPLSWPFQRKCPHGSGEILRLGLKRKETLKMQHAGCTLEDPVFRSMEKWTENYCLCLISLLTLPKKMSPWKWRIIQMRIEKKETLKMQHAGCALEDLVFRSIEKWPKSYISSIDEHLKRSISEFLSFHWEASIYNYVNWQLICSSLHLSDTYFNDR